MFIRLNRYNKMRLTQKIRKKALELGFELVNIVPASPSQTIDVYAQWLEKGYAGKMGYLNKHFERKKDLRHVMPEIKSLVTLAINYHTISLTESEKQDPSQGIISSYAWGDDYHDVVRAKLEQLRTFIEATIPHQKKSRVYVDTGPILEREYANRGGLGWLGKNSMLINWQKGSWFFLAEILLDIELEYDLQPPLGDCGNCTRCIDACPTDAIIKEQQIDSRRCISYLTIELKGAIPQALRPSMKNLIFGCDICQDVCPWNRKAPISLEEGFLPRPENKMPKLISIMSLTQEEFSKRFKKSPIKRTKRRGLLRNVAIALGNWGDPLAIPALAHGIHDHEPLIRSHSAWALGQICHSESKEILNNALLNEEDEEVRQEIKEALLSHCNPVS